MLDTLIGPVVILGLSGKPRDSYRPIDCIPFKGGSIHNVDFTLQKWRVAFSMLDIWLTSIFCYDSAATLKAAIVEFNASFENHNLP